MKRALLSILHAIVVCLVISGLLLITPSGMVKGDNDRITRATEPTGSGSAWYDPETNTWYGRWNDPSDSMLSLLSPEAMGGPDDYGYIWDDGVASSWMEISSTGTDAGFSGSSYGQHTDPIQLSFPFDYYENTYTSLYIAASGYLGFTDSGSWPWQFMLPADSQPNNIIAPFSLPLRLGTTGPANRVYYRIGGSSPNRFFVAEWYQVTDRYSNTFTYQVILHENGDIVFNYVSLPSTILVNVTGIEDSYGLDGLRYNVSFPVTNKSLRFTRPGNSARIRLMPPATNHFTHADELTEFNISVQNIGELGSDTYDLIATSTWPVSFYANDGITPLTDTDVSGTIDTGSIAEGSERKVVVKMQTPSVVSIGAENCSTVTATSSLDSGKTDTSQLCATVPAPFAGVFMDDNDGAISLDLIRKTDQTLVKTTADGINGEESSIVETENGFATVWSVYSSNGSRTIMELYYQLTDKAGVPLGSPQRLIDNSTALYDTTDSQPAIDVAPDGRIAIFWRRNLENASGQNNTNLYLAILNENGSLLYAPTNITNYSTYGTYLDVGFISFDQPSMTATLDNHFVMVWTITTVGENWNTSEISIAVCNTYNSILKSPTVISTTGGETNPTVESFTLRNDRVIIAYTGGYAGIVYSIFNTFGDLASEYWEEIPISTMGYMSEQPDCVQLSNGTLLLAFISKYTSSTGFDQIGFVTIENSSYSHSGTVYLDNPYAPEGERGPSVAADQEGHGIIVSSEAITSSSRRLNYSLVDNDGTVITTPRPFYTSQDDTNSVFVNQRGNIITSLYTPAEEVDLLIDSSRIVLAPLGSNATIPINFRNAGLTTATGVTITADLWWGLTYASDTSGITPVIVDDVITWTIPDLAYLEGDQFNLIVNVPGSSPESYFPVFLTISGSETEINSSDNYYGLNVLSAVLTYLPLILK